MAQDFVQAAYAWFIGAVDAVRQLIWLMLATTIAVCAMWIAYRRLEPEASAKLKPRLGGLGKVASRVGLVMGAVVLLCGALVEFHQMVGKRRTAIDQAAASRRNDPQLSGVVQYAPSVAIVQDRTYTRTLTLPPNFLDRIGADGVQVLAPYLVDPSTQDVLKLADNFKRSGRDVVFTRELTRRTEIPIAADAAAVRVDFATRGAPSGQRHYDVVFAGTYQFHNPGPEPATMRFNFPPPQGGGTIQGFYFDAGSQRVREPDEHGLYVWNATVAPGGTVSVDAHYRVTGGGGYSYMVGSERRRIGDFQMIATSPQELKFGKTGIYPTRLAGTEAEWRLKDVLTAQSIELKFSRTDLQTQLLDKTLAMLPVALVLFALGAVWFVHSRALTGVVAFGIGLLAIPALSGYLSPSDATVVGAAISALGGGLALRHFIGWVLAVACATLACAFLTVQHGSLVVLGLASITMALVSQVRLLRARSVSSPT